MSIICRVYGNIINLGGTPAAGQKVEFNVSKAPAIVSGKFVMRNEVNAVTNASGDFSVNIYSGTEVVVYSQDTIKSYKFTVPEVASANLADLLPS